MFIFAFLPLHDLCIRYEVSVLKFLVSADLGPGPETLYVVPRASAAAVPPVLVAAAVAAAIADPVSKPGLQRAFNPQPQTPPLSPPSSPLSPPSPTITPPTREEAAPLTGPAASEQQGCTVFRGPESNDACFWRFGAGFESRQTRPCTVLGAQKPTAHVFGRLPHVSQSAKGGNGPLSRPRIQRRTSSTACRWLGNPANAALHCFRGPKPNGARLRPLGAGFAIRQTRPCTVFRGPAMQQLFTCPCPLCVCSVHSPRRSHHLSQFRPSPLARFTRCSVDHMEISCRDGLSGMSRFLEVKCEAASQLLTQVCELFERAEEDAALEMDGETVWVAGSQSAEVSIRSLSLGNVVLRRHLGTVLGLAKSRRHGRPALPVAWQLCRTGRGSNPLADPPGPRLPLCPASRPEPVLGFWRRSGKLAQCPDLAPSEA